MFELFYVIIIIRKIEMGCGAVCGSTASKPSKHSLNSHKRLQSLLSDLEICAPLLKPRAYEIFSQQVREIPEIYLLKTSDKVVENEELEQPIIQKWKIILYGLHKSNETYRQCIGFRQRNEQQQQQKMMSQSQMMRNQSYHEIKLQTHYHSCFEQIEKDLNRTFQFRKQNTKRLETVLKRISNHFPSMGYTQGVNFVVGYLLLLGYSQSDAFWMFVHLALNQKYLLLGFYEDGFMLSNIYTLIFKNMLKRIDLQIYEHIFENMLLHESSWIFKWFITYFIYSFPLDTIKYIWDLVIEKGGFGLIYYALALITSLRDALIQMVDECDTTQFFQSLKDLTFFNTKVKINQVIEIAESLEVFKEDFDGIEAYPASFYKDYFQELLVENYFKSQKKRKEKDEVKSIINKFTDQAGSQQKLNQWYNQIIVDRHEFLHLKVKSERKITIRLPQNLIKQQSDIEKSIIELEEKINFNESIRLSQLSRRQREDNLHDIFDSKCVKQIKKYLSTNQQQQKSEHQNYQSNSPKLKVKFSLNHQKQEQKSEIIDGSYDKSNFIDSDNSSLQNHKNNKRIPKINSLFATSIESSKNNGQKKAVIKPKTGLSIIGMNIVNNGCINAESSYSSKTSIYKPKKQKQNQIHNNSTYSKDRIQSSQKSISQIEQSLEELSDKMSNSNSRISHNEIPNRNASRIIDIHKQKTAQDLLANSHGPQETTKKSKEAVSEVQLLMANGGQDFKKKKKKTQRISNALSIEGSIVKAFNFKKVQQDKNIGTKKVESQKENDQSFETLQLGVNTCEKSPFASINIQSSIEVDSIK